MIDIVISRIREELISVFKEVDHWFDVEEGLLNYNPNNSGWSIKKTLEHISLTNHFLLILIRKGTRKSLEVASKNDYSTLLISYDLDWARLKQIGEHKSFEWNRPEHMEPTGIADLKTVRGRLDDQLNDCFDCLNQLKNGEGIMYKTMMTVNDLGKIDVYHYIYFLTQHAKRHLEQMNKIKLKFENR